MNLCGACRFWSEVDTGDKARRFGLCQRHAPVPIMVAQLAPKLAGQPPQPVIQGYFPQTVAHAWCGDFEREPERRDLTKVDLSALDLGNLETEGEA